MAEREGFEPSVPLRVHVISNHAHSTTLPPLRMVGGPWDRRAKGGKETRSEGRRSMGFSRPAAIDSDPSKARICFSDMALARLLPMRLLHLRTWAALLAAAGCTRHETAVDQGDRLQILHFGNKDEPADLDPHINNADSTGTILSSLFDGLVCLAGDGRTILP